MNEFTRAIRIDDKGVVTCVWGAMSEMTWTTLEQIVKGLVFDGAEVTITRDTRVVHITAKFETNSTHYYFIY